MRVTTVSVSTVMITDTMRKILPRNTLPSNTSLYEGASKQPYPLIRIAFSPLLDDRPKASDHSKCHVPRYRLVSVPYRLVMIAQIKPPHRFSGIIIRPIVAMSAIAPPNRNGAAGPYQSHNNPAITLAGNAATPKAALKIP